MPENQTLKTMTVVTFESRHTLTLTQLLGLQAATVVAAPSMKEVPLEENPQALDFAQKLLDGRIDTLILLTGVGTRALMSVLETRHPKEKIIEALKKIAVVPRGPKPVRVLNEWGVPYAVTVPEPNTWRDLLRILDQEPQRAPVRDKQVALQEYGVSNEALIGALKDRGAKLTIVPVYRWALPDDLGPLKTGIQTICDGRADVAMFTTSVQVDHAIRVAQTMGVEKLFHEQLKKMIIASVGPDCSETIRSFGLQVDLEPESPKMAPLVALTAEKAAPLLKAKRSELSPVIARPNDAPLPVTVEKVFLKACRREAVPYTPVWLMRQAGRYMKEYQRIREKVGFLELCKTPALAAQVTLEAQQRLDTDAAILFSDILIILESLGAPLEYVQGGGPLIRRPVRSQSEIDALQTGRALESLHFVYETLRRVKKQLKPSVALIGFAGAPFTLASYLIEGGGTQNFKRTKTFMKKNKKAWAALMEKIALTTIEYLNAQIEAGADAVQLFDSWVGILTETEYKQYALPYSKQVFGGLSRRAPAIHFGTRTGKFLETFASAGGDVIGIDQHVKLDASWKRIGYDRAIQGNLAPFILARKPKDLRKHVETILQQAAGRPGHIFNLGHGVMPETHVENARELVHLVHELSRR